MGKNLFLCSFPFFCEAFVVCIKVVFFLDEGGRREEFCILFAFCVLGRSHRGRIPRCHTACSGRSCSHSGGHWFAVRRFEVGFLPDHDVHIKSNKSQHCDQPKDVCSMQNERTRKCAVYKVCLFLSTFFSNFLSAFALDVQPPRPARLGLLAFRAKIPDHGPLWHRDR